MKLELISHALCPYVHRSSIMLHEKGVAFSRRDVDLKAKPDWFLALSPRGRVPVLVADGVALFESSAINEFLDETHPPRLLPEDPFERARQRAWVEVANDLFIAQYNYLHAPSPEQLEATSKALLPILSRVEEGIASGVIAENGFGLVHVAFAPALHRFVLTEERLRTSTLAPYPKVHAMALRLARRPSVTETVAPDFAKRYVDRLVERGSELARQAVSA